MRSKVIGLCAAIIGLATVQASAADMPVKAHPMAPIANWTGWYIGIEGGGAWGHAEQSDALPFNSGRYNTNGGLVGGTLGYNWQSGQMVYGLETDLSAAWIKGSTTGTDPASGPCGASHCESTINALGTVRGRLGYAWQNWLPYVTGGLAYANVHGSEGNGSLLSGAFGSSSKLRAGWTVGFGLEAMIAPRWTAKIEYLYVDLGKSGVFTDTTAVGPQTESIRETASVVRVGFNYRLGM